MIRIECIRENRNIIYLSLKGHANSDEKGKDLVCAAISAIITGGLNALNDPKSFDIIFEEGHVEVKAKNSVQKYDYDVLKVILTQLKTVQEKNSKYINLVEKGS